MLANLLGVVGLSPPVVSETLYRLCVIDRPAVELQHIRLLTTSEAEPTVRRVLLDPESGAIAALRREYASADRALRRTTVRVDVLRDSSGRRLRDIITSQESVVAADQIYRAVLALTRDPGVPLLASVAGGRKTMGMYLAMAMEVLARPGDRLLHVLVNPPFDRIPEFLFPPRKSLKIGGVSTDQAQIALVDLPFLRTGERLDRQMLQRALRAGGVAGLLQSARLGLTSMGAKIPVRLDPRHCQVAVGDARVGLTPREFALYWYLCERARQANCRRESSGAADAVNQIAASATFGRYCRAVPCRSGWEAEEDGGDPGPPGAFLGGVEGVRQLRSKVNRKLRSAFPADLADRLCIQSSGSRHETHYGVEVPLDCAWEIPRLPHPRNRGRQRMSDPGP